MGLPLIRPSRHLAALAFVAVFAVTWLGSRPALARSGGIASSSFPSLTTGCNGCHNNPMGAVEPGVALTADMTSLMTGQTITLTFVVTSNAPATQVRA